MTWEGQAGPTSLLGQAPRGWLREPLLSTPACLTPGPHPICSTPGTPRQPGRGSRPASSRWRQAAPLGSQQRSQAPIMAGRAADWSGPNPTCTEGAAAPGSPGPLAGPSWSRSQRSEGPSQLQARHKPGCRAQAPSLSISVQHPAPPPSAGRLYVFLLRSSWVNPEGLLCPCAAAPPWREMSPFSQSQQ